MKYDNSLFKDWPCKFALFYFSYRETEDCELVENPRIVNVNSVLFVEGISRSMKPGDWHDHAIAWIRLDEIRHCLFFESYEEWLERDKNFPR